MISTPYVWIDLEIMERNISNMAKKLSSYGIQHRPHIKTHKSIEIARMQLAAGAYGVTCAKISEAKVMAESGIKDILIAYTLVGYDKMRRLGELMDIAEVTVTVDNFVTAEQLSALAQERCEKISILIEVATQINRGGIPIGEDLVNFAKEISRYELLDIKGIFCYIGVKPSIRTSAEARELAIEEAEVIASANKLLEEAGFVISMKSAGSTVTSLFPDVLNTITESRAGNYVFYDMNSVYWGIAKLEDCALKVSSTIISLPKEGLAIIDAGSKTLGSDTKENRGYGFVLGMPNAKIIKLNEEHGFLSYDPDESKLSIGQKVDIIPNHSCLLPNMCDQVFGFRNNQFERAIRIDARGKNY